MAALTLLSYRAELNIAPRLYAVVLAQRKAGHQRSSLGTIPTFVCVLSLGLGIGRAIVIRRDST